MGNKIKVAILGATGHIGKGLTYKFFENRNKYNTYLFVRNFKKLNIFLKKENINHVSLRRFEELNKEKYEVIINCIGAGYPTKLKKLEGDILTLTEKFDNMILDYLVKNKETIYINFSSGAIYGKEFDVPAKNNSNLVIEVNDLGTQDSYLISKLNSEIKHRLMNDYRIIDIRVFSYFSRFIDVNSSFLIAKILKSILDGSTFNTNHLNIFRDYVTPDDLFLLIEKCIENKSINDFFDVFTKNEIGKFELLKGLEKVFNLKFKINYDKKIDNPTGIKLKYYSQNTKAERIGYNPKFDSLSGVVHEIKKYIKESIKF